jgi:hypothetical protein
VITGLWRRHHRTNAVVADATSRFCLPPGHSGGRAADGAADPEGSFQPGGEAGGVGGALGCGSGSCPSTAGACLCAAEQARSRALLARGVATCTMLGLLNAN